MIYIITYGIITYEKKYKLYVFKSRYQKVYSPLQHEKVKFDFRSEIPSNVQLTVYDFVLTKK